MTHPSRSLSRRMSVGVQSDPTKLCATQNGGFGRGNSARASASKAFMLSESQRKRLLVRECV
jgi:hypothetical protein